LVPHERIGRYEVLRKIATGGMAELFLAKHVGMEGFEKVVAIKRILSHLAYDEEFINMFRDEARLVAKLSHPNIVQIYDLGKSNDSYFIAMEYIPGRNLASIAKKARIRQEPLPPPYIARCIALACEALYYAHTRADLDGRPMGIVHRDVSPQNIIVAFSGSVKLVDFGIAKAATKIAHTRAGVLKGKYAYMSPEQIKGEEIDARSDLFSVGIVLYELLCGKRPFEKDNSIQTLKAIVQEAHVDPRVINPQIPDGLADIINKALSKNREVRYGSAQEVQIALEDFVTNTGERANNVVIGQWLSTLFEDEIDKQRGGTITFKGVGEIILPADEKPEPGPSDLPSLAEESAPPPTHAAPPPTDQGPGLERGRGGGSIETSERKPTANGRGSLLKEGVIGRPTRAGDDEATHLARESAPPSHHESVGRPVAASALGDRPLYEEGHKPSSAPDHDPYEDSATEHVPEGSPLAARLKERVENLFEPEVANVPVRDASGMETIDVRGRGGASWGGPASALKVERSEEATVDPEDTAFGEDRTNQPVDDDQWGDRTAANPEEGPSEDVVLASAAVVAREEPWDEATAGPKQGSYRSSFGPLDDATLAGASDDDLWGEKTSANPDDPAEPFSNSGGVAVVEPDLAAAGQWVDKTTGSPDPSDDPPEASASDVDFADGHEANTEWGGDLTPDPAEDDPEATSATAAWRALPEEGALPLGIDLSKDVGRDSRTVAATSDAFQSEGIEIPASGAFAYDAETHRGEDEDPALELPKVVEQPRNNLGAIRLAKAPAVPRGGVREQSALDEPSLDEPLDDDLSLGLDDNTSDFDRSTQEVVPPKRAEPPRVELRPKSLLEPSAELERPRPASLAKKKDWKDEHRDTGPGPAIPDFDELFRAPDPKPIISVDPLASIGSTRVPPSSVSLSEMLMDSDDRSRQPNILRPVGGTAGSLPRQGSLAQGGPSHGAAPPVAVGRPIGRAPSVAPIGGRTALRQIKEVRRGALAEPGAMPNLPIPGLGTPVLGTPSSPPGPASSYPAGFEVPAPARTRFSPLQVGIIAFCAIVVSAVAVALVYVKYRSPSLEISTAPPGARVVVAGQDVDGLTPVSISIEPEKDYPIQILMPGYQPLTATVKVPRGKRAWRANYTLLPQTRTADP